MKTIIHTKIDKDVKEDVQNLAKELGILQISKDAREGKNVSTAFDNMEDAIKWLNA